ncbi:MAG: hypothetical protein MJZ84_07490 [Paludibacteraceae bacterium]|nr:hypothetical protein [Paludibacteraceae bacterium]
MFINGRQYEFADISIVLGGRMLEGLRGIKYTPKQEKELMYGKGNKPRSIQKGNISYDGELSIDQGELETLRAFALAKYGDRSILKLSLDAAVCYGDPSKGEVLVTDILIGIQFTEEPKEMKQGDKFMEVSLPFIYLDQK